MKKAINLILAYIFFLILGIIIFTLFNIMNMSVQSFIAGREIRFFVQERIIASFFKASFICICIICPCIAYYRIRHPGGILQALSYIIICGITWFILFPCVHKLEYSYSQKHQSYENEKILSAGYFRRSGNKIYYFKNEFTEVYENRKETNVIIIDLEEDGKISSRPIVNSPYFELNRTAAPFSDVLIKQNFEENRRVSFSFNNIIEYGRNALNKGITFYLGFISMALIVCCLYAMTGFFEWKLLNSCFLIVSTAFCYFLNSFYFSEFLSFIVNRLSSYSFIKMLANYFDNPLLVIVNVIFAFLFIIMGLIRMIVKKHKAKN